MEISHAEDFSSDIRSQISALEEEEKAARKRIFEQREKSEKISAESKEFEEKLSRIRTDITLRRKKRTRR